MGPCKVQEVVAFRFVVAELPEGVRMPPEPWKALEAGTHVAPTQRSVCFLLE